jgi:hypothetical protein
MIGASGTYAVDNVDLQTRPTSGKWVQRKEHGIDGNGHSIYSSVRNFEIKWNLMHPDDWATIINAYNTVQNTGTLSWDLPHYGSPILNNFKTYSGTVITEPEQGEYFQGWVTDVSLLIYNVRT